MVHKDDKLTAVNTEGAAGYGTAAPIGWGRSLHFVKKGQLLDFFVPERVVLKVGKRVGRI